jgi:hypothetical protein
LYSGTARLTMVGVELPRLSRRARAALLAAVVLCGCQCGETRAPEPPVSGVVASGARPKAAPPAPLTIASRARLVVAVVFDQLGSDTLLAHYDLLDEAGAIRRASAHGAFFERSEYPYANTQTAPGHATIHTGASPPEHGIDGNSLWNVERAGPEPAVADARYPVFGREAQKASAGPGRLRAETVAQALKRETGGRAKVVSLSIKDRSAILSAGAGADLVLWYDAQRPGFTSSSAWGNSLPEWLLDFQVRHPLRALLIPWLPDNEALYRARLGPDDAAGEGDWAGFGTQFPHGFERVKTPFSVLTCTPQLSEHLVALAARAVEQHGLGQDEVPDLLALSISGTDCAGHVFGPRSWEYVDHLIRADRSLGAWLSKQAAAIPLAWLITSDHGVAQLAESHTGAAGRVVTGALQRGVEAALAAEFGPGPFIAGVLPPFVHLAPGIRTRGDVGAVRERAISALRSHPGIAEAWLISEVRTWQHAADPLRRAAAAGVAADNPADVMFITRRHYSLDIGEPSGSGTNHGSPYEYDRQVPVLVAGPGVPAWRQSEPVSQLRVAATLAQLLGIPRPGQARGEPLF